MASQKALRVERLEFEELLVSGRRQNQIVVSAGCRSFHRRFEIRDARRDTHLRSSFILVARSPWCMPEASESILASRPFLRGWKFSLDVSHSASAILLVFPKERTRRHGSEGECDRVRLLRMRRVERGIQKGLTARAHKRASCASLFARGVRAPSTARVAKCSPELRLRSSRRACFPSLSRVSNPESAPTRRANSQTAVGT